MCVSFLFEFQTWSPCKGIISSSLPDVNKKKYPGSEKWRHFDRLLRVLKVDFENVKKVLHSQRFQDSDNFF
jgi:hypothetical protein